MLGFLRLNDRAQFRHDLIMRDPGPGIGQGRLHLRTEPGVVSLGFLGRRELGLDGGEFGHEGSISGGADASNGGLPVATGFLDCLEQRLFGGGAAEAAVAGHVSIGDAEFGAAASDLAPEFFERDWFRG